MIHDEKKGVLAALAQEPDVQAAFIAIDVKSGDILAMVGGYDYAQSQFNRVTQAVRQAGSSIKPFVYATALEQGFTELSVVPDAPIAIGSWSPKNYKHEYIGPITLKTALAKSINTVSVRLVLATGVDPVVKMMRRLGITTQIVRNMTISVGTPDVRLIEMTGAYATFPAGGRQVVPRFVTHVTSDHGRIIEDARPETQTKQALSAATAYLMVDLMKGVVQRGTARKAQALGRPAAGKTGTSTDCRDAWFIGFTSDVIAGVWVGRDNFKPIGADTTGGNTALPIWMQFMRAAHPDTPVRDFEAPSEVTFVRVNELTGMAAPPRSPNATWVPFARGTLPPRFTSTVDANRFRTAEGFQ